MRYTVTEWQALAIPESLDDTGWIIEGDEELSIEAKSFSEAIENAKAVILSRISNRAGVGLTPHIVAIRGNGTKKRVAAKMTVNELGQIVPENG
ncbi:MAG: hypothetical protein BWY68_00955 [bacterium ADurb.Bin400]|nr:MAG: hypothetical protein BWY68_00955 [bacterium ADurb.Bin400]